MSQDALTFSGMALDRAPTMRSDDAWISERLRDPASRAVAASSEGVLLDRGSPPSLLRQTAPTTDNPAPDAPILLGLEQGEPLFAVDLDALAPLLREGHMRGGRIASLREAGALLPQPEGGLAAYLVALLNWHRSHRFCPDCGAPTVIAQAGASRRCTRYGTEHFPRTDPAVIVLVENAGRALLGRHANWPPGQYSVLAGFVGPGESLTEAVAREVYEESGIEVRDPTFVTSQPWPFPTSLMLGFHAWADAGEPTARDGELEDVRWFTHEQVGEALIGSGADLRVPPPISIARFLLARWWRAGD
jgi:NAD+ diphosphatase